jgi:hypothetical protein
VVYILPYVNVRVIDAAAVLVLAAAVSLQAHHNANAEYNPDEPVTITGRLTKVEWTNPHAFLELERKTPEGQVESWRVETAGPAALTDEKITREMLALDTVVTINGWRAKNGSMRAWGIDITFPDGAIRKLTDSKLRPVDDFAPPSYVARVTSALPFLPYLLAALPVIVLVAGVIILRRRGRRTGAVSQ